MFSRKRLFLTIFLVLLLAFSFASIAAANQLTVTAIVNGKKVPVNVIQGKEGTRSTYKLEIPWQDLENNGKVTIQYRINLKNLYPGSQVLEPPAFEPLPQPKPVFPKPCPPKPKPKPSVPKPQPPIEKPEPPVSRPKPPAPEPELPSSSSVLTVEEKEMLDLINEERAKMGLNELKIHEKLVELARLKSKDMIEKGYFAHQSPTYGSPFEMMQKAGITFGYAGENLAGAPVVSRAHTSLMNSPGHRANILSSNFTHLGIGIIDGGPYGKMFTQLFIGK
ncbi:MAG: sporulation protein [Firmicutes bacterium]|nr:sporulation protein [Bacillota bacterium]